MNSVKPFALLLLLVFFIPVCLSAQTVTPFRIKKIVIDAGHGGNASGATWGAMQEKTITLSVALKLGRLIRERFPDVEVIYTRTTDVAVDLNRRSDIANKSKADLFISIHVNASKSTSARGMETWVMGFDKSQKNLDVAMRENSVISYEDDYQTKYEGFDPSSVESYIIFSLMQYAYLEQSLSWAALIQKEYATSIVSPDRGVRQGPFLVLWRTTMPCLLTEIGFLSNDQDRKFLSSSDGQNKIARALLNAFGAYKQQSEKGTLIVGQTAPSPAMDATATENRTAGKQESDYDFSSISGANIQDEKKLPEQNEMAGVNPVKTAPSAAKTGNIVFCVQVRSAQRKVALNYANFGRYRDRVTEKLIDARYKYFVGELKTYKDALSLQKELKKDRFTDSFVVAFRDGKPIELSRAIGSDK